MPAKKVPALSQEETRCLKRCETRWSNPTFRYGIVRSPAFTDIFKQHIRQLAIKHNIIVEFKVGEKLTWIIGVRR